MTTAGELRSGKGHKDENFPVASWIIHPRHRALILAFYNFVRINKTLRCTPAIAPDFFRHSTALQTRVAATLMSPSPAISSAS